MAIEDPLTEEREEKMVSSSGEYTTLRIGRFLKPCADCPVQAASLPHAPLLSETMSQNHTKWPLEVRFKGCYLQQRKWKELVDRLARKHEFIWKKAGIYHAILSSTYPIQIDRELLLGLSEFWCSGTNTFVFPWGEATMTLEDILVLGGFSIEEKLIAEHKQFSRSRAKKAEQSAWINRFMSNEAEGETEELEHVALLVLRLSRFCFPSHPGKVIGKHVFSVAVHLSQGTRLALAPAILASLYKDLRFIHEQLPHVKSMLKQIENFEWRPYVSTVNNWSCPSFYKEREELLNNGSHLEDDELQAFVRCLRSCELVGLDCVEQYLPHRVARQFGIDQDLPGHFPRVNSDRKIAWGSYDHNVRDPRPYIRSRFIETNFTQRYVNWWKECMVVPREAIKDLLEKRERKKKNFEVNEAWKDEEQSNRDRWGDHPLGFAPKKTNFIREKHSDVGEDTGHYESIEAQRKRKSGSAKTQKPGDGKRKKTSRTSKLSNSKALLLVEEKPESQKEEENSKELMPIWNDTDHQFDEEDEEDDDYTPIAELRKRRSGSVKTKEPGNGKWEMTAQPISFYNSKGIGAD
ncbi:uncharacterized protein LOC122640310 [Telopea speciosissima]|uniref:uncharacterized protein LOC122640310 n=1 Tax=Telopea speciosissima TaxID=54955 RepID=UPI001CC37516|nr:uncharacterized protein LOC122640310 [Telopea speciosissima]